jgi:dipeptidyl aminopeptidase/acylaminoacyl peptidase
VKNSCYAVNIVRIVCLILILIGSFAFAQTQTQSQTQSQPQTDEAPPDTEIFLFPFDGNAIKVDQIRNITSRKGYDNQPSFFPDGQKLFYTSIRDSKQADIFLFEIANQKTTQITSTEESEYSPTVMPDGKFFSTVRVEKDETQRLWKFPIGGGGARPELILREIKPVGYHAWLNSNSVALFILGEPPTLQVADVTSGKARTVASNIGRGMSKIPGKQSLSFVSKETETKWTLKEWDPSTGETKELATTLPESEDIGWTPDGTLLSASGSKVYRLSAEKQWEEIADLAAKGLSRITRIAVSPKGNWIAIVSETR